MFETLDLAILSRIQFAFTIGFHIIWPALTIGLGLFLLIMEALYLKTQKEIYVLLYKFWVKIYALAFGIGVVTGIALSFQFGTNFSELSRVAGPILGPLLGVEVMTAFFLEAAFIGVMLFGWGRVTKWQHFAATLFVVLGTHNSAFWIIAVNSWMHTPDGIAMVNGVTSVTDWMSVIFNPSFPYRMVHMTLASYLSGAVLIAGVSALYLLKRKHYEFGKAGFSMALWAMLILAPLQLLSGHEHGINTLKYQPVKVAAMEGLWDTTTGADLLLFAIPNSKEEKNTYELRVPKLASWVLTGDMNAQIKGLKDWPKEERPPVGTVFWSFRIMVGIGMLFIFAAFVQLYYRARKRLYQPNALQALAVLMMPLGFVATITGWTVTEVGRQPWVVYGVMTVKQSLSPVLPELVAVSLAGFVIVYTIMFVTFLYYFIHLIKKGPLPTLSTSETDDTWLHLATHTTHITGAQQEKK